MAPWCGSSGYHEKLEPLPWQDNNGWTTVSRKKKASSRDLAGLGCKIQQSLAGIRRLFDQPRRRLNKQRQVRQGTVNTFAERSGAGNAPDVHTRTERKKLECCEEGRARPRKSNSKPLNWEDVFGSSDVPKALSDFYSTFFDFRDTVAGPKLRRAVDEQGKWEGGSVAHTHCRNTSFQLR